MMAVSVILCLLLVAQSQASVIHKRIREVKNRFSNIGDNDHTIAAKMEEGADLALEAATHTATDKETHPMDATEIAIHHARQKRGAPDCGGFNCERLAEWLSNCLTYATPYDCNRLLGEM